MFERARGSSDPIPINNRCAACYFEVASLGSSMTGSEIPKRFNVRVLGDRGPTLLLAHGFGCDQSMWRFVVNAFREHYRIVLFDYIGHGDADVSTFDETRYSSLHGYSEDLLAICDALNLRDVAFVGHSVSAMIGVLAAIERPEVFARLILVGPSPYYINEEGYQGGFTRSQLNELIEFLDENPLGWSQTMAPAIMGNPNQPALSKELEASFCRTNPRVAKTFARATFLTDHRGDLPRLRKPSLILQCSQDVIAPNSVGEYMHQHLQDSTLVTLKATGHCPHLSAPDETIAAIGAYLNAAERH
jgi:sigma-B regulation protein RsbQ